MPVARKTLAKYGAKIPVARSTGAKLAQPGKQAVTEDADAKAGEVAKKKSAPKKA